MYLYSTLYVVPHSQGAQAWITVLPAAITPMPAFTRTCSPDGASQTQGADI